MTLNGTYSRTVASEGPFSILVFHGDFMIFRVAKNFPHQQASFWCQFGVFTVTHEYALVIAVTMMGMGQKV